MSLTLDGTLGLNSINIGANIPGTGAFTTLNTIGNVTLGDASGDTVTFNAGTVTLNNSTTLSAASTKTLTLNGGGGSNGLVLDASNNVGIGTGTPGAKLDVSSGDGNNAIAFNAWTVAKFTGTEVKWGGVNSSNWQTATFYTGGSERMRIDSSGNLGLGITPSAWGFSGAFELPGGSVINGKGNGLYLTANSYYNGGWKYATSSYASYYYQANSAHVWATAASGTAGNAISFTQAMTLDASGNLLVGGTASSGDRIYAIGYIRASSGFKLDGGTWIDAPAAESMRFVTSDTERARIDSSGNLLVGQTSASYTTLGASIRANGAVNSASAADFWNAYSTLAGAYRFYVTNAGTVYATNTTIAAISDQRLKENIQDLDVGLSSILALKPRKFDWKEGKGKDIKGDRGFIAQEFEQVFPDLIDAWKDEPPEGEEPYKAVRQDLIPVMVKALQELHSEIESLKARIN